MSSRTTMYLSIEKLSSDFNVPAELILDKDLELRSDESSKSPFLQNIGRIKSMALIHEILYQNESFANIHSEEYLSKMAEHILLNFKDADTNIEYRVDAENFKFDVNTAIPCGMIFNELVTNACVYAFIGRKRGTVKFTVSHSKELYILTLSDNGIGMPAGFKVGNSDSLGFTLVNELTDQIGGTLKTKVDKGASFTITFKKK